jgi:hypothetical protein
MPFALPTDNPHSFRDCRNPDVGCAEQREAYRSRLMRLLASAHPTGSRHKGITGDYVFDCLYQKCIRTEYRHQNRQTGQALNWAD